MPELRWQKSSFSSEASNCLELATAPDGTIRLRESDDPTVTLALRASILHSLLAATRLEKRSPRSVYVGPPVTWVGHA